MSGERERQIVRLKYHSLRSYADISLDQCIYIYLCVCVCVCVCGPGSPVGIATDYGLDVPGSYIMHSQYTTYIKQDGLITIRLYLATCFGRDRPTSGRLRTTLKVQ